MYKTLALALALFLAACGTEPPECEGQADVTWVGWTDGFFQTWCRACHSQDTPERQGAPVGVDFDTLDDVREWEAEIRDRVLIKGNMPLGGGVPDDDLVLLETWLDCGY